MKRIEYYKNVASDGEGYFFAVEKASRNKFVKYKMVCTYKGVEELESLDRSTRDFSNYEKSDKSEFEKAFKYVLSFFTIEFHNQFSIDN